MRARPSSSTSERGALPALLAIAALLVIGCRLAPAAPAPATPQRVDLPAPQAALMLPAALLGPAPVEAPVELPQAPVEPPRLPVDVPSVALVAGRSLIDVEVPGGSLVSIGVFGPQHALLGFDVLAVARAEDGALVEGAVGPLRARRPLDEDGLLPRVVSFRSPADATTVRLLVDAAEPVELRRAAAPVAEAEIIPKNPPRWRPAQAPSIGFPAPVSRDEGYFLQSPARYQFARTDVIAALLRAFQRTRARFKRDPIAIADISQWDGIRPATDLGKPRHISHEGGRDVDVALAANDEEPSTVRAHCTGVLVEQSVQGCGPGTARGFDAQRMAYFLGALFETYPLVEKIFVDDVYLRELRLAAEKLHDRKVLKDAAWEGLSDDAIVRASPWHTDHLHVRFAGPQGKPGFLPPLAPSDAPPP